MNYVDLHVHIDFYDNPVDVASEYDLNNIYALFVTNLPQIYEKHFATFPKYKKIRMAIGYHPELANRYEFNMELFERFVQYTNYIGEVGLDFSKSNLSSITKQTEIFNFVCSEKFTKTRILLIHSKKAEDKVIDILEEHRVKFAIFHWYSGSLKALKRALDLGYYFSINPSMLKSEKGQRIIKEIPSDRMLVETDGPFVRWNKHIIKPSNIKDFYKQLGDFLGNASIDKMIFDNFNRLLEERKRVEDSEADSYIVNAK
jgi:TatD DNase family protein